MSDVTVLAEINYSRATNERPMFHANDSSLDRLTLDPRVMPICDARSVQRIPTLASEGFELLSCPTAITDFRDTAQVERLYPAEIERFMLQLTGADAVVVTGPAVLRFGERSSEAGSLDNSRAARFVHIDVSDSAAMEFARSAAPQGSRNFKRIAQHNIWRTFSPPPQDVPLALCDARTVSTSHLISADARFDRDGEIRWQFEALLLRYDPGHRWFFFSNMQPDEVVVFKRHDTDAAAPHHVPHCAFTDSRASGGAPRASAELRTIAYWLE